jgi:hypothetical protein
MKESATMCFFSSLGFAIESATKWFYLISRVFLRFRFLKPWMACLGFRV